MSVAITHDRDWFKSSYSGSEGDSCVEVAYRSGAVLVRDSKEAGDGPTLAVTPGAWTGFVGFAGAEVAHLDPHSLPRPGRLRRPAARRRRAS